MEIKGRGNRKEGRKEAGESGVWERENGEERTQGKINGVSRRGLERKEEIIRDGEMGSWRREKRMECILEGQ